MLLHSENPEVIPIVNSDPALRYHSVPQLANGRCSDVCANLKPVQAQHKNTGIRLGLFNAQSIRNKSASIENWISTTNLNIVALTETWHDGPDCPDLVACSLSGYHFIEQARQRSDLQSTVHNHGGVGLLFDQSLHARRISLPSFNTFESVAAIVNRSAFNAAVVLIYRPWF